MGRLGVCLYSGSQDLHSGHFGFWEAKKALLRSLRICNGSLPSFPFNVMW